MTFTYFIFLHLIRTGETVMYTILISVVYINNFFIAFDAVLMRIPIALVRAVRKLIARCCSRDSSSSVLQTVLYRMAGNMGAHFGSPHVSCDYSSTNCDIFNWLFRFFYLEPWCGSGMFRSRDICVVYIQMWVSYSKISL